MRVRVCMCAIECVRALVCACVCLCVHAVSVGAIYTAFRGHLVPHVEGRVCRSVPCECACVCVTHTHTNNDTPARARIDETHA